MKSRIFGCKVGTAAAMVLMLDVDDLEYTLRR